MDDAGNVSLRMEGFGWENSRPLPAASVALFQTSGTRASGSFFACVLPNSENENGG